MINFALIGVGKWGKNYLSTTKLLADCRIKYVVSKTQKTLQTIQGDYIKTTKYTDLFSYKDIDGVIIATPQQTHFEIASEFIKKGFNILLEKPMTGSYKDALKLQRLWKKKKTVFMINHIYLYNPAFLTLKQQIKNLGQIQYLEFEGSNWGPFRNNVSTLWDYGAHDIAMCLDLLGDPTSVQAWGINHFYKKTVGMNDIAYCLLSFEKGIKVFIKVGRLSISKKRQLTIVGTKKIIHFDELRNKKISIYSRDSLHDSKRKPELFYPKYKAISPLENVMKEFISCLKSKKEPYANMEQAVQVIHVIDAMERSLVRMGSPVTMKKNKKIYEKIDK